MGTRDTLQTTLRGHFSVRSAARYKKHTRDEMGGLVFLQTVYLDQVWGGSSNKDLNGFRKK